MHAHAHTIPDANERPEDLAYLVGPTLRLVGTAIEAAELVTIRLEVADLLCVLAAAPLLRCERRPVLDAGLVVVAHVLEGVDPGSTNPPTITAVPAARSRASSLRSARSARPLTAQPACGEVASRPGSELPGLPHPEETGR